MGIFNKIGDLKKEKNQFKLFKMLMEMGLNKPNVYQCRKWVESEFKKAEAKKQTTLGDF